MISDLALEVLTEAETLLAAAGRVAPTRSYRYWGPTPPIWPCAECAGGELVVYIERGFQSTARWGQPGWEQGNPGIRCDVIVVRLVRPYTSLMENGTQADTGISDTFTEGILDDLEAIWHGLVRKTNATCSPGFTHSPGIDRVTVVDWKPLSVRGGRAAFEIRLLATPTP